MKPEIPEDMKQNDYLPGAVPIAPRSPIPDSVRLSEMAGGPNEVVGCIAVAARGRRRGQGRETGSSSGAMTVEK